MRWIEKNLLTPVTANETACTIIPGRARLTESFQNKGHITIGFNASAFAQGYQRLSRTYERDHCASCLACKPSRVLVQEFAMSGRQSKIMKNNADIIMTSGITKPNIDEHFPLFTDYYVRHKNHAVKSFLEYIQIPENLEKFITSQDLMEFRHKNDNRLTGALIYDGGRRSLSGTQYYYDREESRRRSLGTFMILSFIQHAHAKGMDYVYLGSVTPDDKTAFSYKTQFRPLEIMGRDGRWHMLP